MPSHTHYMYLLFPYSIIILYICTGSHHPRHLHSWSRSNDEALTYSYMPQEDPLSQPFDDNSIHFTNTSLTSPSFCGIQYSQFQKRCCYTHLSLDTASVTSAWQTRYCQSVPPLYQYSCWYHHHCYCSTHWVLSLFSFYWLMILAMLIQLALVTLEGTFFRLARLK